MSIRSRCLFTVGALFALFAFASTASAKTYEVTRKGDPTPGKCKKQNCSLREAVRAANKHNGKDQVVLPSRKGAYKLKIESTGEDVAKNGDIDITDPLKVTHKGKGRATVNANKVDRAFDVLGGAPSTFRKLVIVNGKGFSPGGPMSRGEGRSADRLLLASPEGGAIRNDANIKVISSLLKKNKSAGNGGGIGVINGGGVTVIGSTLTRNKAATDGGGIDGDSGKVVIKRSKITNNNAPRNAGGIYYGSSKPSLIEQSTIAGNKADKGGGVYVRSGMPGEAKPLKVDSSTISGNKARSGPGGGFDVENAIVRATNSTIYANKSKGDGGGIANPGGKVVLNAVSVVRNVAGNGGSGLGGGIQYGSSAPGFEVENSLIALNRADGGKNDCSGESFYSEGHNLLSTDSNCGGFDQPGDRVKSNPKIGKLKSNGGPTKTVALKKGSPAINKAQKSSAPKRDQRGHKRGNKPDVGAYER